MDILLIKSGEGLAPADEKSAEYIRSIQAGEYVPATIKVVDQRSLEQLRLFWSCCQLVANNTEDQNINTKDKVAEQIKIACRFVDTWYYYTNTKTGEKQLNLKTKSIAFDNLRQVEANNFFDEAFSKMAEMIGITKDEMMTQVERQRNVLSVQSKFNGKEIK